VRERIQLTKRRREKGEAAGAGHRVLFDDWDILDIPQEDKEGKIQEDNALLFVSAGFETTGFAIETAMYYVLSDPAVLSKLKRELTPAFASKNKTEDLPSWTDLEKLPYLTAVIYEAVRMSLGVSARLPRKNVKSDMLYKDWVIPKGQFVGMTQRDILYNADIFPDPERFDPERWLNGEESKELLNKYLVTFSKGARRCVGMQYVSIPCLYLCLS
jgi:cytochrome P450